MKYLRLPVVSFAFACLVLTHALPAQSEPSPAYVLTVHTDHEDAIYRANEPVSFVITFADSMGRSFDGVSVDWTLATNGLPPSVSGTATIQNGEGRLTRSFYTPGFYQCRVTLSGEGQTNLRATAVAAIDPERIKPALPVPQDFDDFWTRQKQALSQVPPALRLTPVVSPRGDVVVFDLQADCIGAPVSGYLARPANAKPRSLPAILTLHGAGVRDSSMQTAVDYAHDGMLALDINAHGLPNGQPDSFYEALNKGNLSDYRSRGARSRDTIYFRGMFLRVLRAIDALSAQPEWDGRVLIAYGISQGGAQAIVAAGLDPRVSFFVAGFPAMCDHAGMVAGRVAGWPKIVPVDGAGNPDPVVLESTRYYDMVNFATRAKVPGVFAAGFIDGTCAPSSVYAAYNALPSRDKVMINDIAADHMSMRPQTYAQLRNVVKRHLEIQGVTK